MTLSDESEIDSRQPIDADPGSAIVRRALSTSWLWWEAASSVVLPILESEGDAAFALIVGTKSTLDFRTDGSLRRSRLSGLLGGGVGTVSVTRSLVPEQLPEGHMKVATMRASSREIMGSVGIHMDRDDGPRWRLLKGNAYYLKWAGKAIDPCVIVNTDSLFGDVDTAYSDLFESFEDYWLATDKMVLVLPHTSRAQGFLDAYLAWVRSGRPTRRVASESQPGEPWTPDKPPDPLLYAHPIPTSAEFQVTGLIEERSWQDPSHLESARRLLESRFDLKLGIWDLVRNDTLRDALLEDTDMPAVSRRTLKVPKVVMDRANETVERVIDQRRVKSKALAAVNKDLQPILTRDRWRQERADRYTRAITRRYSTPWKNKPEPLAHVTLFIDKRRTFFGLQIRDSNDLDLGKFLRKHGKDFAFPGEQPPTTNFGSAVLWEAEGGWADDVDWSARANEIRRRGSAAVEAAKKRLIEACVAANSARHARYGLK